MILNKEKLKILLYKLKPKIYNLPEIYFVKWLDYEFYIKKL